MPEPTIAARFKQLDAERTTGLDRAREMAAHTDPSALLPSGHNQTDSLPEPYTSEGAIGTNHMVGQFLMNIVPPLRPWLQLALPPSIFHDQSIPDDVKSQANQWLFLVELAVQASYESAGPANKAIRRRLGFRSQLRRSLNLCIVTGDVIIRIRDDFRLVVFGRRSYVTKRDSCGDVLFHVTKECIDYEALSDDQKSASGLEARNYADKMPHERQVDLYTLIEWEPSGEDGDGEWVITQEINERKIPMRTGSMESRETVSPYLSVPFILPVGYDYGIGFPEAMARGDLISLNALEKRRLEMLSLSAYQRMGVDYASMVRDKDLRQATGSPLRCKMREGKAVDIGPVSFVNIPEFRMISEGIEDKKRTLGRAMLVESMSRRDKERVTAREIGRDAAEVDIGTGGLYTPIADDLLYPLARRGLHILRKNNNLPGLPGGGTLPDEFIDIIILTGLTAIAEEAKAGKMVELADVAQRFGEAALDRIDAGVLMAAYARARNFYEPGMLRSDEETLEIQRQRRAVETEAAAAERTVDAAATVAEQQAAQPA